ncbi:hypothetical protein [Haladaptatus cibarius]|uniref:hypothetical protein n=1 Tax=Haladaptatus cibarius TaxID=453847 RepID=UPI0006784C70|nr:hypothetical protein [Haladaptatus cibarius]
MNPVEELAQNLLSESKAYGYTLMIWGGGAILMNQYGSSRILEIFLYVVGALVAFGAMASIAFDDLFEDIDSNPSGRLIAASMVHVVATFGNLLLSYSIVAALNPGFPANWVFLAIGFQGTLVYNLLLLLEDGVARFVTVRVDAVGVSS